MLFIVIYGSIYTRDNRLGDILHALKQAYEENASIVLFSEIK